MLFPQTIGRFGAAGGNRIFRGNTHTTRAFRVLYEN